MSIDEAVKKEGVLGKIPFLLTDEYSPQLFSALGTIASERHPD